MRELQVIDAAELAAAYAGASYCVLLDGETLPLRVGHRAADLEAYWPAARYLFITAWNPASEPHADAVNQAADVLLVARLGETGAVRHAAWAEDADRAWREPGWLVADLAPGDCLRLAREFGQAGLLAWEHGQPVRLQMALPRPAMLPVSDFIDWVE